MAVFVARIVIPIAAKRKQRYAAAPIIKGYMDSPKCQAWAVFDLKV